MDSQTPQTEPTAIEEVVARYPFSEPTRRHRRTLMAIGLLCIAMPVLKIQPTATIWVLKFEIPNLSILYSGLIMITAYFLVTFWHNAQADLMAWDFHILKAGAETDFIEKMQGVIH